MWEGATINPLALYADSFRMIAMDQRNAGQSFGPLESSDPWGAYAKDQLALLDHLGIDRFHVMGACIGGPFGHEITELAPAARIIEPWNDSQKHAINAATAVHEFLLEHSSR